MKIKKYVPLEDAYRCKGRNKPTKKGHPFCWKVKAEGTGHEKKHRIEFHSTRTGEPVGYMGPFCRFVTKKEEALTLDYLNAYAASWEMKKCLMDAASKGRRPFEKVAKQMMKDLKKASE